MPLTAEHLTFTYRSADTPAVHDISAEFECGKVYGIFGRNGCGKTTLLKLLSQELRPDSGTLHLDGRPFHTFRRKELAARIAVVEQEIPSALPFNVRDCVMLGRYPHLGFSGRTSSADQQAVSRALERTAMAEHSERPYDQLSGGMKQLAMLARALAQDTDYLLCDEPANRFDPGHLDAFYQLAGECAAQGKCVIIICHDLFLAPSRIHEGLLIRNGSLFRRGTPEELFTEETLRAVFGCSLRPVR